MGSFVHTAELPCADPNGRANRAVLSSGADLGQLRVTAPDDERLPARAAAGAYLRSAYRGYVSLAGISRWCVSVFCFREVRNCLALAFSRADSSHHESRTSYIPTVRGAHADK